MCWIMVGVFFFFRVLINVLLIFSLVSIFRVLNVGFGWKLLVIVCSDFCFLVVKVCRLCWICRLSWVRILFGRLFGDWVMKYILMFFEWISWIICFRWLCKVFGVLLNSRWVLLKNSVSIGLLVLLCFGSCLNSLVNSQSRKVVQIFGVLCIRWLVLSRWMCLCLFGLGWRMFFSCRVGLLKKVLVFCCFRVVRWCSSVCLEVLVNSVWFLLRIFGLFFRWLSSVFRFFRLSSSRFFWLVIWKVVNSVVCWLLVNFRRLVSSSGFILLMVVCNGWLVFLVMFQSVVGQVFGWQFSYGMLVICLVILFCGLFGVVMLYRLFLMLVVNIVILVLLKDLVRCCKVIVLLVLVVLVINL